MDHTFMIYHLLLCGRPEVFQGDSSFGVLQAYDFPCQRWVKLDCESTRTSKHRRGLKTLYNPGLEESVLSLKWHFVRPSQW